MKKVLALVLALALLCTCLAACGDGKSASSTPASSTASTANDASKADEPESTASGEKMKIGILAPAVTHGWVAGVAYYAEARCKELSDTVEYRLLTSSNAEEMTNQIDDLNTWGAQAVVAFHQWEGIEDPIKILIY